jgi:hypothetical protein
MDFVYGCMDFVHDLDYVYDYGFISMCQCERGCYVCVNVDVMYV